MLLEIKGKQVWSRVLDRRSQDLTPTQHLVGVLERKAMDSLALLSSVWLQSGPGLEIAEDLPAEARYYPGDGTVVFVFVLDTGITDPALLSATRDSLNARLAGRLELIGCKRTVVLDVDRATRSGLPVRRA